MNDKKDCGCCDLKHDGPDGTELNSCCDKRKKGKGFMVLIHESVTDGDIHEIRRHPKGTKMKKLTKRGLVKIM
jgi:hypothetical protein